MANGAWALAQLPEGRAVAEAFRRGDDDAAEQLGVFIEELKARPDAARFPLAALRELHRATSGRGAVRD